METWSTHHLYEKAAQSLGAESASDLRNYAQQLISKNLPVVFTLGHLSKITGVSYRTLHETVNRKREKRNYKLFAIKKRSGGKRFIHAASQDLFTVQQFINQEILQQCLPHSSSFAFHKSGGIKECASMHCGAKWLFQYDLTDFFFNITEVDVYQLFQGMGYRQLLAFELARICTTTHLPKQHRGTLSRLTHRDYNRDMPYHLRPNNFTGVLPQGAPTSPVLSNLSARKLDESLSAYALEQGFVYTRYADDITISATVLPNNYSIGGIHKDIVHRIRKIGFKENDKKTRVAGPGSKKIVLGLLVDGSEPRITKETYRRVDRHLHAASKYGLGDTATHEGFDSAYGFFNHLSGLIAFVKDVDLKRWEDFNKRFKCLTLPWEVTD